MTTFENSRIGMTMDEKHESPLASGRLGRGLFYGLLLAVIYGMVAQTIDLIVMRDVPLAVDWNRAVIFVVTTCLGGVTLGAVVAWPHEGWKGALAGAVAIAGWGLLQSALLVGLSSLIFLPTVLPLIVLSLPISGLVRLAINLHENAMHETGQKRWRNLALVLVGTMAVATLAGSWSQMPPYAQDAVRKVERVMQFVIANPDRSLSTTLRDVPEILDHLESPYTMYQTAVDSSTTGVEVNVMFEDGFEMSCLVGQEGDTPYCQKGLNVFSNPGGQ